MSNSVGGNPIIIDTAFTTAQIGANLTGLTSGGPQRFRQIRWVGPVTVGDECKVVDANNNVLFDEFCSVAKQDVVLWDNPANPYVFKQDKWAVPTLTSGKLYLWK